MSKKSKFENIIENRYINSIILAIILSIIGILRGYVNTREITVINLVSSVWWNIKFFALILITYELFIIITSKNQKISLIGSLVVIFSSGVLYNFNYIETLMFGELIVVLIEKLITNKSIKIKLILSISIVLSMIVYMFTYVPYAVAFGYVFFALIIWIFIKNKVIKDKDSLKILVPSLIIGIIASIVIGINLKIDNCEQIIVYKSGISNIFNYLYNILLPFNSLENKFLYGSIVSLYPLPMLLALYYLFNKDEHIEFLLPITIVSVIETVFVTAGFPEFLRKVTLFSNVNLSSCALAVNFANLLIIFYFLENVKEKLFKFKNTIRITIVLICCLIFIERPNVFSSLKFLYLITAEMCLLMFLFLNYDDKKYKNVFLFFMLLIALVGGVPSFCEIFV